MDGQQNHIITPSMDDIINEWANQTKLLHLHNVIKDFIRTFAACCLSKKIFHLFINCILLFMFFIHN